MNNAAAARVEAATATGEENGSTSVASTTMPTNTPDEQACDDHVGERAADQPVDLVQAVFEDRNAASDRHRNAEPGTVTASFQPAPSGNPDRETYERHYHQQSRS